MSDTELLPKSKPEPVRRLEVFTGSGRRRMWTPAQKAEILAEIYDSGDTVSAVARRHGLANILARYIAQYSLGPHVRRPAVQRQGHG